MPSTTTGGTELTALKKLNGAALTRPAASTVVAKAIGRGTTVLTRSLYASLVGIAARSKCIFRSASAAVSRTAHRAAAGSIRQIFSQASDYNTAGISTKWHGVAGLSRRPEDG